MNPISESELSRAFLVFRDIHLITNTVLKTHARPMPFILSKVCEVTKQYMGVICEIPMTLGEAPNVFAQEILVHVQKLSQNKRHEFHQRRYSGESQVNFGWIRFLKCLIFDSLFDKILQLF